MTGFLLAALAAVSLSACGSDYTNWESRGPDSSTASAQKRLMLPPDFFLRAPAPAQKPAGKTETDKTENKNTPQTNQTAAGNTFASSELAADEAAEPSDVRSNTPDPLAPEPIL